MSGGKARGASPFPLPRHKHDLLSVVVTSTRWEEPPRFRHQITRQLMRFGSVLFVVVNPSNQRESVKRIDDRLTVYQPATPVRVHPRFYWNVPFVHHFVNSRLAKSIGEKAKSLKVKTNLLINFEYHFFEIYQSPVYQRKVYICNDEFTERTKRKKNFWLLSGRLQMLAGRYFEQRVIQSSDTCFAASQPLVQKLRKTNQRTHLLLAGHEACITSASPPRKRRPFKVGYMGYTNNRLLTPWLDLILCQKDMELFLIGPTEKFDLARYHQSPRFHYCPPLTGSALHTKLREMDVFVIPFNVDLPEVKAITASNKLFQLLAAGKPVVISDMPYYLQFQQSIIYRSSTGPEFIEQIRKAFHEDTLELAKSRQKIAAQNTWNSRGDLLWEIIQKECNIHPEGMKRIKRKSRKT